MSKITRLKDKERRSRKLARKDADLAERAQLEKAVEEAEVAEAETEPAMNDSDSSPLEKSYDTPMGSMFMGPTSFDELDALRNAQEKADEVREVSWDVQDLVRNILSDPFASPTQKAGKLQAVASGFETRLSDVLAEDDLKKDLDVLQIEAILATEARKRGVLQKAGELVKEFLSPRKELSEGDYAYPGKKKYPIQHKAQVRNTLVKAAQDITAGGQEAEDARFAMPAIRAAAKQFGVDAGLDQSAFLIEKDAKGDWRWIGIPTNNFIDWQNDIISKSAHEKYVAWLDENPELAPVFVTWHEMGTARVNPADFWMEKDGALIMSGILNEHEAASLLKMQAQVDLGMSFQGVGLRLDEDPRIVTDYFMFEVSDLPRENAANPFTSLETITKEVGMDKLQYLTGMMGSEEKAKAFLKKTGEKQAELQAAGFTSKEKPADEPETKAQAEIPAAEPAQLDVKAVLAQITKQIKDDLDIDGLSAFVAQAQEDHEKVEILESLLKAMQGSQDDALAEKLIPPAARYAWSQQNRPSQANKTKLSKGKTDDKEDEDLMKSAPGVPAEYWLSEATGTVPVAVDF